MNAKGLSRSDLGQDVLSHQVDFSLVRWFGRVAGLGAKVAKCRAIFAVGDVEKGHQLTWLDKGGQIAMVNPSARSVAKLNMAELQVVEW